MDDNNKGHKIKFSTVLINSVRLVSLVRCCFRAFSLSLDNNNKHKDFVYQTNLIRLLSSFPVRTFLVCFARGQCTMSVDLDNSWSPTTSTDSQNEEISDFSLPDEEEKGPQEQVRICQYAHRVVDFSSQYGSDTSISYTAYNIIGRQSKYPDYGDFPETFAMVSKF